MQQCGAKFVASWEEWNSVEQVLLPCEGVAVHHLIVPFLGLDGLLDDKSNLQRRIHWEVILEFQHDESHGCITVHGLRIWTTEDSQTLRLWLRLCQRSISPRRIQTVEHGVMDKSVYEEFNSTDMAIWPGLTHLNPSLMSLDFLSQATGSHPYDAVPTLLLNEAIFAG